MLWNQKKKKKKHHNHDEEFFSALGTTEEFAMAHPHREHRVDIKHDEYYSQLAKKSPKDHLHLFALDWMRVTRVIIIGAIGLVVLFRLMLIAMSVIFGRYYVSRQVEYTIAWILIFSFAICYQPVIEKIEDFKKYSNRMRLITFLASAACLLKAIITLIYNWDMFKIQAMMTVYCALEVSAWIALSIFFFAFWRYWNRQRHKMHIAATETIEESKSRDLA